MALVRLRRFVPVAVIALLAIAIAWAFAVTVLRHTRPMGFPLDDSYIYLTYAKQFGRGQPFTYFPGGGYSAGSTSVLWPMLLAPFWTLGARGHALVWVSYLVCATFYALTCLGVYRIAHRIAGALPAAVSVFFLFGIAPFAWTSLSGMEVAFASALLVAIILLLLDQPTTGRPTKRLIACLAAASLSRPEATVIVVAITLVAVIARVRQRDLRAAAWWLVPLAPPALWLVANKLLAGQLFPNTGVAKSYFYLPGFDWSYWLEAVWITTGRMLRGLFWDSTSPLVWPKLAALAWIVGAVRVMAWARREQRYLVGVLVLIAPFVLLLAVIASSGLWSFQNYRYIAPAFPLLAISIGVAVAPFRGAGMNPWAVVVAEAVAVVAIALHVAPTIAIVVLVCGCVLAPFGMVMTVRWTHAIAIAVLVGLFARAAIPRLRADAKLFAQGAMDTNTQVVAIGEYLQRKLPEASVMFHDAGAIAYYGDGRVYDMLGLVTNHQAGIANHGPGSRFEFLENLSPDQRPTHFAYYPGWLGTGEFFGDVLVHTPLRAAIEPRRLVGDGDMQLIVANWDHVGTGERPLDPHPGWTVVDRIDIARLASERAHQWRGDLGRRSTGDPTAKWSFVGRETQSYGLVLDGGRTIRGGHEQFTIAADRTKRLRLVLRTGGQPSYPFHDTLRKPVTLRVLDAADRELAKIDVPAPTGRFIEIPVELPAGTSRLRTDATGPYRVFHWFVLQPD